MENLISIKNISAKQYFYELPDEKIAYFPLEERDQSKLLVYKSDSIIDDKFSNILDHISDKTLMVFNESKVINARLKFFKETGATIEIFCVKPVELEENNISNVLNTHGNCYWQCLVGGMKKWKNKLEPIYIDLNDKNVLKAYIHEIVDEKIIIKFEWEGNETFNDLLIKYGHTPLPPYIKRDDEEDDKNRYQTVFANNYGSVAAPTASLHFSENILNEIEKRKITKAQLTLHVGAGTFLPMKSEWIDQHSMHEEIMECTLENLITILEALHTQKNILAVGTTATRSLESLYWLGIKLINNIEINWDGIGLKQWEAYELQPKNISAFDALSALKEFMVSNQKDKIVTQTQIFMVPGYEFKIVDILQTNFHQPESTLLMLVSAFLGFDKIKEIYKHAIDNNYRFLSYGDCSLLFK